MMAILLRLLIGCMAVLAFLWWRSAEVFGWGVPVRLIGTLPIALPHALFLAAEFVLLARFGHAPTGLSPAAPQLLRAWWGEVWTGLLVFGWRLPFRATAVPDQADPSRHDGRRGVVLVHGFVCNRAVWTDWMRAFQRLGVPFAAVNLEPVFSPIDSYSTIIEAAVQRMRQTTGLPPVIVAHSMGGLAVRCWLRRQPTEDCIDRIVTIGTPHAGTWLARFALTPNGRQMRLDSRWIAELSSAESPRLRQRFICFYGHCDNIVFPTTSATLAGADNRHLPGVAHLDMVSEPEILRTVLRLLDRPLPAGGDALRHPGR